MKKLLFLFMLTYLVLPAGAQVEWTKSIGGSWDDVVKDIHQTSDGGYIAAGYTFSNNGNATGNHGKEDGLIIKLSSSGSVEWQKCFGGSDSDRVNAIIQTNDGGCIAAGYSSSIDGDVGGLHGSLKDVWIIKLSSAGALLWQKCLGGTDDDRAYSIQQTSDNGYIVSGSTRSNNGDVSTIHGGMDAWVIKLSESGNIEWQKTFGGKNDEVANSIAQTLDGGYIFTGSSCSIEGDIKHHHELIGYEDAWIVKLSATGYIEWERSLGGGRSRYWIFCQTNF